MPRPSAFFNLSDERGVLRTSVAATVLVAVLGLAFGLFSGSYAIIFDGIYSLIDAGMSLLSLLVVNLIVSHTGGQLSRRLRERFSMGLWHLEPMVLGLNGVLLITAALYALVTAIGSLLSGGRPLAFGWAIVYAAVTLVICTGIAVMASRANRRLHSAFIRLDIRGWVMSASITAALLVAFVVGYAIQDTSWAWLSPYIDPAVLALVCLLIIPLPVSTIRQALADVFLVTPIELKRHVDAVAQDFVDRHGLVSYRSYVARVGRCREIELYFIVPADAPARTIGQWDALRDEVGALIGGDGPDRWLIVTFTGDPEWAE